MGGSPCQGFSFAGKQLNFNDPRSKLFFQYVRALDKLNPKYFLLENVKMKKKYQDVISEYLGVEPIEINSSLVSAQNRVRLYWTNIPDVEQPADLGIYVYEILEQNVDEKYYMSEAWHQWWDKNKDFQLRKKYSAINPNKAITMTARQYSNWNGNFVCEAKNKIRRFTPIECERLQTLPDNYTNGISNTQRYKVLGNGWTVDVIAHIFSYIPETHLNNVVSLFDGISCGQVALERAGKTYGKYYASEIDKYAMKVTQNNYPNTIQLGDITKINWGIFKSSLA